MPMDGILHAMTIPLYNVAENRQYYLMLKEKGPAYITCN